MITESETVCKRDNNSLQAKAAHNPVRHTRFLKTLQKSLQRRYDVSVPYCVSEFVSHNSDHVQSSTGASPDTPEMLLFRQSGDNLDITLFLDAVLLDELEEEQHRFHLGGHLSGKRFDNCCIVLEGVSHFLYLTWNAHHDRQVRLIDIELQAEVDKFIYAALDTHNNESTTRLIKRLYGDVSYRSGLSPELKHRYEKANTLAKLYCDWLSNNFSLQTPNRELSAELARFYRLNGDAKQSHITRHLH